VAAVDLAGRLDIDAAGVPARVDARGDTVTVSTSRPTDLLAEVFRLNRAVGTSPSLRRTPLTLELRDARGLVLGLGPGFGPIPSIRPRRPVVLARAWWRSRRH
jgi:hypothetical protein